MITQERKFLWSRHQRLNLIFRKTPLILSWNAEATKVKTIGFNTLPIYTHKPNWKDLWKMILSMKGNSCCGSSITMLQPKHSQLSSGDTVSHKQNSPTSTTGASGQWCLISGHHFVYTFSKEEGLTTLKQIKNTSVYNKENNFTLIRFLFELPS